MKGVEDNSDILINVFKAVESIMISECYEFKYIFTPATANFDLGALTSFQNLHLNGWFKTIQESDDISEEMDYNIPDFPGTSQLLHTCHHLQRLDLNYDKQVEVVFDMDSPSSSSSQFSANRGSQQPLLPYLEVLSLSSLQNMSHVWKCNWNEFLIPQQPPFTYPFRNLSKIFLLYSHRIKYLLSPLMGKFLSNLKDVTIKSCDGIEEVISSRDDENATFTSSHTIVTLFPHLETLKLHLLKCLQRIDGGDTGSRSHKSSFNTTTSIDDEFQSIKVESETINNITQLDDEGSASGGTTLTSPMLKSVIAVPQPSNLKDVYIFKCDLLQHVFTFSALECLKKLKTLSVQYCKATQVIVKEEQGEQTTTTSKVVVFPHLATLLLVNLSSLEGFFLGKNHEFRWPLLNDVIISGCPNMIAFTSGHSKTPRLKYIRTELGKHSLECGLNFHGNINQHDQTTFQSSYPTISEGTLAWSFHNLIELTSCKKDKRIIPSNALLQVQKLEKILLNKIAMVEEVFEVEALEKTINDSGFIESQTVVEIPKLREVDLQSLYDLKYLWKSNGRMVLEFPKLTSVSIGSCKRLEHIFTCSMVGSLVHLQDLHIYNCDKITVIVKEEEEVCDAKVNDIIVLPRLKSLRLKDLRSLKGFCLGKEAFSCPSLDTLQIEKCPAITVFTKGHIDTSELKEIDTRFGICDVSEEDLNSFIKTKQEEGYQF